MKQILVAGISAVRTSDQKEIGRYMQVSLRHGGHDVPRSGERCKFFCGGAAIVGTVQPITIGRDVLIIDTQSLPR